MLDRNEVIKGNKYLLNGKIVIVLSIHRPGNGESVSLSADVPEGVHPMSPLGVKYWLGTMAMRKFQRQAKMVEA